MSDSPRGGRACIHRDARVGWAAVSSRNALSLSTQARASAVSPSSPVSPAILNASMDLLTATSIAASRRASSASRITVSPRFSPHRRGGRRAGRRIRTRQRQRNLQIRTTRHKHLHNTHGTPAGWSLNSTDRIFHHHTHLSAHHGWARGDADHAARCAVTSFPALVSLLPYFSPLFSPTPSCSVVHTARSGPRRRATATIPSGGGTRKQPGGAPAPRAPTRRRPGVGTSRSRWRAPMFHDENHRRCAVLARHRTSDLPGPGGSPR